MGKFIDDNSHPEKLISVPVPGVSEKNSPSVVSQKNVLTERGSFRTVAMDIDLDECILRSKSSERELSESCAHKSKLEAPNVPKQNSLSDQSQIEFMRQIEHFRTQHEKRLLYLMSLQKKLIDVQKKQSEEKSFLFNIEMQLLDVNCMIAERKKEHYMARMELDTLKRRSLGKEQELKMMQRAVATYLTSVVEVKEALSIRGAENSSEKEVSSLIRLEDNAFSSVYPSTQNGKYFAFLAQFATQQRSFGLDLSRFPTKALPSLKSLGV